MWELALGGRLNHRPVLQDSERAEYVRDALNLNLVRTSEYVKSYNNADHVYVESDAALLEKIAERHGERPSVISTMTALEEYDAAGLFDADRTEHGALTGDVFDGLADRVKWYGNVLGSNEFDETRVGAVIGSNHYGDGFIKKWGAYAGRAVERETWGAVADDPDTDLSREELDESDRDPTEPAKGAHTSYGAFGNDVLQHMREHDTLQAAMRFGRDGNGAVVYGPYEHAARSGSLSPARVAC